MESKEREKALIPLKHWKLLQSMFDEDRLGTDRVYMIFDMSKMIIERVTNNCIEFWGYSQDEMEGQSLSNFLHPNDLERTLEIANVGLFDMDAIRGFVNRYMHKNGEVIHNEWNTGKTFNNVCFGDCKLITESEFYHKKQKQ